MTNVYAVSHQTGSDLWSFLSCRHPSSHSGAGIRVNGTNRIKSDCDGTSSGVSCTMNIRLSLHIPNGENEFKRYLQSFYECCR